MDGIGFFCEKPSKFDENHILPSKIRRNSFIFVVINRIHSENNQL
jgi:hypothetical protein